MEWCLKWSGNFRSPEAEGEVVDTTPVVGMDVEQQESDRIDNYLTGFVTRQPQQRTTAQDNLKTHIGVN